MITNPRSSPENEECRDWLAALVFKGIEVVVPEIADYEVRADKTAGLARLDAMKGLLAYAPITTPVMVRAAGFWATARKHGRQAASDASLDADMILVAQAAELRVGIEAIIATTNVRHLALFSPARLWREIT